MRGRLGARGDAIYYSAMFARLTQFDLHHRIAEQTATTLVFFTSPACASCRHLKVVLGEISARHPEWRVFEVDAQQEAGLVNEFDVFHLPSLFLFARGDFHAALSCEASPGAIEAAVASALLQPAQEAP